MIVFGAILKWGVPFDISEVLGDFSIIFEHDGKGMLWKWENDTDTSNVIIYKSTDYTLIWIII